MINISFSNFSLFRQYNYHYNYYHNTTKDQINFLIKFSCILNFQKRIKFFIFKYYLRVCARACTLSLKKLLPSAMSWTYCGHYTGYFSQVLSSQFLNLSYFTTKDETPVNPQIVGKTKLYKMKRWYRSDLGYKSTHQQKPTSHKKILKINRLILSKFFYFESRP